MRKFIKKPLSMILSAAMVFTSYNYNPIAVDAANVTGKVEVKSYSDLKSVQEKLDNFVSKNESNISNCTFTIDIKEDIVGTDENWVGIDVGRRIYGQLYEDIKTVGLNVVVNGNGHTISKLSNKNEEKREDRDVYFGGASGTSDSSGVGLFGEVNANLNVTKLVLSDCDLRTRTSVSKDTELKDRVQTDWNSAVLAGSVSGSVNIDNITVKNSITDGLASSGSVIGTAIAFDKKSVFSAKNVKVENCKVNGPSHTGGIFGSVNLSNTKSVAKIENCSTDNKTFVDGSAVLASRLLNARKIFTTSSKTGAISGSGEGFAGIKVGGLIGAASFADIVNCTNNSSIKAVKRGSSFTGGIVGFCGEKVTIRNSTNNGFIDGISCVGGISGYLSGDSSISDCKNSGNVICTGSSIGGIVGSVTGDSEVEDVINTGKVVGISYVGGTVGDNRGKITNADNTGSVNGGNIVGGNVGYNRKDGNCDGLSNEGVVTGKDNVGGNIGLNDGIAKNLGNNDAKVTGNDNVGGNVGKNTKSGELDTLANSGDVKGHDNVGGNVGDNLGKVSNVINTGKVEGNEGVGGNVGNNERDGSVSNGTNTGDVKGNKDVDNNIGKDDGYATGLKNLPEGEDGAVIVGPKDVKYPDLSNSEFNIFGMKIKVVPRGTGAVIFNGIKNGTITLTASPVYGYKFNNWKADGTTPATSIKVTETFKIKKGAKITCNFSKAKDGDTLVPEIKDTDKTPASNINKVNFYNGLTLAVTPAKAGRIDLVSMDKKGLAITAVPKMNAKFVEWKISGKVSFAKDSTKDSQTATFVYNKGDKATITAVFKMGTIPAVGKKIKDRKYYYRVVKQGSLDGSVVGELQVIGLRKKTVKNIKIAKKGNIGGVNYIISSIGENAFKGNKRVKTAYISRNITKIGSGAFANMKNLKKVTLGSRKLRRIGAKAFYKDKKLKTVIIKSKKITKIGKKAFATGKKVTFKVPKSKKKKYTNLLKRAKTKKFVIK